MLYLGFGLFLKMGTFRVTAARLSGLHSPFNAIMSSVSYTAFGEITQNNGSYAVSWSSLSVAIESHIRLLISEQY